MLLTLMWVLNSNLVVFDHSNVKGWWSTRIFSPLQLNASFGLACLPTNLLDLTWVVKQAPS